MLRKKILTINVTKLNKYYKRNYNTEHVIKKFYLEKLNYKNEISNSRRKKLDPKICPQGFLLEKRKFRDKKNDRLLQIKR